MTQHNRHRPTRVPTDLVLDSEVVIRSDGEPVMVYWMAVIDSWRSDEARVFDGVVWREDGSIVVPRG